MYYGMETQASTNPRQNRNKSHSPLVLVRYLGVQSNPKKAQRLATLKKRKEEKRYKYLVHDYATHVT
jgi:hypothetical protein